MKTLRLKRDWMLLVSLSVCALNFTTFTTRADLEVTASVQVHAVADFYTPLAADGAWIQVGSYGRCWRPSGISVDWRPYCSGHWVWTDCGWYWASDEPWAWACYHYGSWAYDSAYGWIWVPGIEWAPAWVTWRVGGGYIGWAPLPPRGFRLGGPQFVFVQESRFSEPLRPGVVVVNNTTIFGKTTVVNNVRRETRSLEGGVRSKVVVNEGPGVAQLEKGGGRKFRAVPIQEAARQAVMPARMSSGTHAAPVERPRGDSSAKPAPFGNAPAPAEGAGHGRDNGHGHDSGHGHEREGNDHGKDRS